VAGKGGTGKTSIASLIIRYLLGNGLVPLLAIDADPNANLGESLGLEIKHTIGTILNDFQKQKEKISPGMTKENYLEYRMNDTLVESKNLDLLPMGLTDGPGCYCYPNVVLKKFIDKLSDNYACTVMDNEAGMEHLSRRTTQNIDELLLISDHSVKGIRTLARIKELVSSLKLEVKRQWVLVNFTPGELGATVAGEIDRLNIGPVITVPLDSEIYEYDVNMKPLLELPDSAGAVKAVNALMTMIMKN